MKANKIIKAASVVLTASIAFMATGCTVEIKDDGNTVDRIIAAAEKSNSSDDQDTTKAQTASTSDTEAEETVSPMTDSDTRLSLSIVPISLSVPSSFSTTNL